MFFLEIILSAAALAAPMPQSCGHSNQSHGGHAGHSGSSQSEPSRPKVRATNTICPVMGEPVQAGRDREVVVREGYYLVCCDGCGPELADHKDKYLDRDGRPRNAPKNADDPKKQPSEPQRATDHSEHKH
jgi:hypothetical protein